MYSAKDIAIWFIYKTNAEIKEHVAENDDYEVYEGITHLKLQKLLYFAQGVTLSVLDGKKLFDEKILAWEHGPVISEIYEIYKINGRNSLSIEINYFNNQTISKIEADDKISEILNLVYDNFAIYTAWQLRELTHKIGSPWDETVKKDGLNSEIPISLIKKYFDEYVVEK